MSEAAEKKNTKGKLIADFKTVIGDIEVLLKEASGQLGDKASGLKEKLNDGMQKAKRQLDELESTAKEKGREAIQATDGFVHDRPWESVGIGFGIGVLVGILLNRR